MTRRERTRLLLLWVFLGFLPLLVRPLWEPDEGRYAEIPREMLATGDWLTPRLNGVLYFEKPPLQYWLSALSMKLFGLNGAAARLPLALASGLMIWAAWRLAKRLGARDPLWAPFMAATGLLGFLVGQLLTLDALFSAFLVAAVAAFVEAVARRREGSPARAWTLLTFLLLAGAMLTKGLAELILTGGILLFSLAFAWKDPELRRTVIRTALDPLGWLLYLLLAVPWFWAVNRANPGHAQFFFIHEHFTRFLTHEHARQGSNNWFLDKLYFVGVLALGLLPWLSATLVGLKRSWIFLKGRGPQGQDQLARWIVGITVLGFLWPLAFFSLSGSKLAPYILPALVPLAALACTFEREGEEGAALRRMGWELLVLGGIFLLAAFLFRKDLEGLGWVLAMGAGFAGLGLWAQRPSGLSAPRLQAALGVALWLLVLAVQSAAGPGKAVADLVRKAPKDAQWISYGNYFQGLPFYAHTRAVVVAGTGELAFGRDRLADAERWFSEDPMALGAVADRLKREDPSRPVLVMAKASSWEHLDAAEKARWAELVRNPAAVVAQRR
ncbi:glycosyltransferase family 39 protein [Geothrix sp. PMB-07]|uniref:glycosyltransferase family 39 protein n=1 Tax=Geothrix sp. PMB-07 TaxID=3068640 RepID=UPI002740CBE4|nr:glycosyltransferase family 39 protein [Geothrix sp. PMB-07]WLT33439.1 glycosyltransferase family 39 protein [Geothrix sp. PMB-07]